ncbi:MAG: NAD(P)H:quinone oxidoreductase [Myxococcales bacterium]|nr:NAD(P)H:quinone oxidoreductase [Myxococcales bacterium]
MSVKVSVVYYSSTGNNHAIAEAVAEGARAAGAEVRVRRVAETAPAGAIASNPGWQAFHEAHKDEPTATVDDVVWADAVVFGTPTRFGNMASQLKAFVDTLGGAWFNGKLQDKVYSGFTSAQNAHGGQESTLLSLYNMLYHWGGYIVTPGYTDKSVFANGGNPYGVSATASGDGKPGEAVLAHARYMGERVARVAGRLRE